MMDTDEREDDVQLSYEIDDPEVEAVLHEPVDKMYHKAVNAVHKLHPQHEDEIIEWFDKLRVSFITRSRLQFVLKTYLNRMHTTTRYKIFTRTKSTLTDRSDK